ncbi:Sirohydrochlorin cobaltochelatase [Pirellula sp. SH-Sr6A]|uniref:sirohydrochlorin chelatase n=1 Tax=Pirellula sp. SH-Sr6A TaxID=1632865 RepID=UPI00078D6584|nr:sirohydrochlorin chelatase [Pirellula sp. SH-Sr6A]AMV34389.1 Sirohydrochlorin cobaltochelatase [Pirellula sp. SH-Sr6A]
MFEQVPHAKSISSSRDEVADPIGDRLNGRNAGVLVVGHGTRKLAGQEQLLLLSDQIASLLPGTPVEACFLELAEPDIEQGLCKLREQGCEAVVVVPVLLFTAAHAKSDIPDAVAASAEGLGLRVLAQTASLEVHPAVLALSKLRFDEILGLPGGVHCPSGGCAAGELPNARCDSAPDRPGDCPLAQWLGVRRSGEGGGGGDSVALAMVGRGTSDRDALEKMRLFTELRCKESLVAWSETGFFAGGKPDIDDLLERASRSGCDTVIVQPHLLFEGELIDQLRQRIRERRAAGSGITWWITRTLGADPALARVFLELLKDATSAW